MNSKKYNMTHSWSGTLLTWKTYIIPSSDGLKETSAMCIPGPPLYPRHEQMGQKRSGTKNKPN